MSVYNLSNKLISYYTHFINRHKKKENYVKSPLEWRVDLLNSDQLTAYRKVEKAIESKTPLYYLILGVAGTGKSFLLNNIRALLEDKFGAKGVMVLAPTGVSASHISGRTIHSAMHIPFDFQNTYEEDQLQMKIEMEKCLAGDLTSNNEKMLKFFEGKQEAALEFKENLSKLRYLIIDEISLLSLQLLGYMESLIRTTLKSTELFGGISVIFCGDYGQIPAVAGSPLYGKPNPGDLLANAGFSVYRSFKNVIFLEQVVRQDASQVPFLELLVNLRRGTVRQIDIDLVNTRAMKNLGLEELKLFEDAMHIYPYNNQVNKHNMKELLKLNTQIVRIQVEDDDNGMKEPECVMIGINSRVMLLQNVWTEAGLVNGSRGVVDSIVYPEGVQEPSVPAYVNVKFDRYFGPLPNNQNSIPIQPMYMLDRSLKKNLQPFKQIPLKLSYSSTVHKAQSQTIDKLVVDFSQRTTPSHAQVFVALSRVRKLTDLALVEPFTLGQFKPEHDGNLQRMLKEERRLKSLQNEKF